MVDPDVFLRVVHRISPNDAQVIQTNLGAVEGNGEFPSAQYLTTHISQKCSETVYFFRCVRMGRFSRLNSPYDANVCGFRLKRELLEGRVIVLTKSDWLPWY